MNVLLKSPKKKIPPHLVSLVWGLNRYLTVVVAEGGGMGGARALIFNSQLKVE